MAKFDPEEWKKRIAKEIGEEEARAQTERDGKMDADFDKGMAEVLGMPLDEFQKAMNQGIEGISDADVEYARKIIAKGKKLDKKGRRKEAHLLAKDDRRMKRIAKQAKKGKGCAVVGLLLVSGLAGMVASAGYGVWQLLG